MRMITSHVVDPCNEKLGITVMDQPGSGGAHHEYMIAGFNLDPNTTCTDGDGVGEGAVRINFQNGPIAEVGTNGITHEALIAILIDRLQCFQNGPYKCRENAMALTHLEEAMMWLQERTRDRISRGVEGTQAK